MTAGPHVSPPYGRRRRTIPVNEALRNELSECSATRAYVSNQLDEDSEVIPPKSGNPIYLNLLQPGEQTEKTV